LRAGPHERVLFHQRRGCCCSAIALTLACEQGAIFIFAGSGVTPPLFWFYAGAEGRPSFAFSYSYAEVCYCCGVVTARTLARDDQVAASLRQQFPAAAPISCCVELAMVAIYIFPCEFAKCSSIGKRWSRGVERRAMLIVVVVAYAFTGAGPLRAFGVRNTQVWPRVSRIIRRSLCRLYYGALCNARGGHIGVRDPSCASSSRNVRQRTTMSGQGIATAPQSARLLAFEQGLRFAMTDSRGRTLMCRYSAAPVAALA
jgi:hypothetical protein